MFRKVTARVWLGSSTHAAVHASLALGIKRKGVRQCNLNFNPVELDWVRKEAGSNAFTVSQKNELTPQMQLVLRQTNVLKGFSLRPVACIMYGTGPGRVSSRRKVKGVNHGTGLSETTK